MKYYPILLNITNIKIQGFSILLNVLQYYTILHNDMVNITQYAIEAECWWKNSYCKVDTMDGRNGRVGNSVDVQGRAWAFAGSPTVPPRKTSDCDLLQMTRDIFGALVERLRNGIRYICALQYFCVNSNGRFKRHRGSCPGFSPNHRVSYEQVGGVAAEPLGTAPDTRRIGWQQRVWGRGDRGAERWLAMGLVACRGHARKKQHPETGRHKAGECLASFLCLLVYFLAALHWACRSGAGSPSHNALHSRLNQNQCQTD